MNFFLRRQTDMGTPFFFLDENFMTNDKKKEIRSNKTEQRKQQQKKILRIKDSKLKTIKAKTSNII